MRESKDNQNSKNTADQIEQSTVERILDAAATIFAEHGFHGARINDIAKLANINKAQLYYHLGNKEKIYEMILVRHFKSIADEIESAVKNCEDPIEGINTIVRVHANNFKSDERAPRTIAQEFANGSGHMTEEAYFQYSRIHSFTESFIEKGMVSGLFLKADPDQVNVLLNGTLLISLISDSFRKNLTTFSSIRKKQIADLDDMARFSTMVVLNYLTAKD